MSEARRVKDGDSGERAGDRKQGSGGGREKQGEGAATLGEINRWRQILSYESDETLDLIHALIHEVRGGRATNLIRYREVPSEVIVDGVRYTRSRAHKDVLK